MFIITGTDNLYIFYSLLGGDSDLLNWMAKNNNKIIKSKKNFALRPLSYLSEHRLTE